MIFQTLVFDLMNLCFVFTSLRVSPFTNDFSVVESLVEPSLLITTILNVVSVMIHCEFFLRVR